MTAPVKVTWGGSDLPQLSTLSITYDPMATTVRSYGGQIRTQFGRPAPAMVIVGTWEGLSEAEWKTLEGVYFQKYDVLSTLVISTGESISNVLASGTDFVRTPRHNTYKNHWRNSVTIRWVQSK